MPKKKSPWEGLYTLRADGRYMGYCRGADGKRKAVYGKTEQVVYEKIQALEAALVAPKAVTFREVAEDWQEENWRSIRDGTKSSYAAPLARALKRFGDWPIQDITPKDLTAHLLLLASQKFSRSTIKIQKIVYSRIFKHAIAQGVIRDNPAAYADIPTDAKRAVKRDAPDEETIQQIKASALSAYFGQFAMFCSCTGFRRGEALATRWRDIDWDTGWIHCSRQIQSRGSVAKEVPLKTEAGYREVPLLPALRAVLTMPENADPDDFIFPSPSDPQKPMPQPTFNRKWMHYCKDMGFVKVTLEEKRRSTQGKDYVYREYAPTLTPHYLRHAYATMLFEAGVDEFSAMTYLGHSNISITREVYTNLRNKQKTKSTEKLLAYSEEIFSDNT